MVLGTILYEGFDLVYNLGRLTFNGVRGTYYWWTGGHTPEVERELRAIEDIETLTTRIEELEKLLHAEASKKESESPHEQSTKSPVAAPAA